MAAIEKQLADVLADFARTLVTDFPIQGILDHLVVTIVDMLPISAAGVTLISPGTSPQFIAASDESAWRFEQLQTELSEGPCLAAYSTGESVAIADLNHDREFPRFSRRAVEAGLVAVFTFPLRQQSGQLGALDLYRTTPGLLDAEAMSAAQTLADVTAAYLLNAQARAELMESSETALENSLHDPLTGLPNRTLLVQRLDHAILRSQRSEKTVAILFADLDRFKVVNDTYGHQVGDELLVAVANRISGLLRPGDTLARLAGDEFIILCDDLDEPSQAELLATRVGNALAESFQLLNVTLNLSASVGIAFAGPGHSIPERIIQDADIAMYQAKRKGGARFGTIDVSEQRLASRRVRLTHDLRHAEAHGELRNDYQPIVALATGEIVGVEALLRWVHPFQGLVAPVVTIPLAERSGLIVGIGRWVMEKACADRERWLGLGGRPGLTMAVNVSVHQLIAPGFVETVAAVLTDTHTDPTLLTLEVTESVLIEDSRRILGVLGDLKHLGVMLALDDFGTGYSSLSYLKDLPIDSIKIDRTFIADLERKPIGHLIVDAVVGLAHGLDMTVVAEGVESADQFATISGLDCDWYQGYYFARPMTAEDVAGDSRFAASLNG
jgi:diguanylate cyclase (GGDEF)-like protein